MGGLSDMGMRTQRRGFPRIEDSGILRNMKSVELFAGAGGLGIGLHQAGFSPLNVIEWDRYCCDTLRDNLAREVKSLKDWGEITEGDVREIGRASGRERVCQYV